MTVVTAPYGGREAKEKLGDQELGAFSDLETASAYEING